MHSAAVAAQAGKWMTGPAPTCSGKTNSVISQKARRPGGREAIQRCQLLERSGSRSFSDWAHLRQGQGPIGSDLRCCSPLPRVRAEDWLFKTGLDSLHTGALETLCGVRSEAVLTHARVSWLRLPAAAIQSPQGSRLLPCSACCTGS